jgi:NAD+ kinase
MKLHFKKIAIFGRQREQSNDFIRIVTDLKRCLHTHGCSVFIEQNTAESIQEKHLPIIEFSDLDPSYELIIVVGGDGSLLNAARAAASFAIPIVGINRGRLGFLADIVPNELETTVSEILLGQYQQEQRFLLQASIEHKGQIKPIGMALNDIVLLPGHTAHMIEFAIYINEELVCQQRADGLITATPTGSTAYALSGGGPILHPRLDALVMVPMFPHTLSSRPIVIDGNSQIKITIADNTDPLPAVSYDGYQPITLSVNDHLHISKTASPLTLIHPKDYNYYEVLRSKLGWQTLQ